MINKKRLYNVGFLDGSYGVCTLEEIREMEKESAIYSCSIATIEDVKSWIALTGEMFEDRLLELKDGIYWWGDAV